jgi:ER lumen protein retaining receptor
MMEYDIHTALDFATLAATGWVIWQLSGPCAGTFQAEQDSLAWYWVVSGRWW